MSRENMEIESRAVTPVLPLGSRGTAIRSRFAGWARVRHKVAGRRRYGALHRDSAAERGMRHVCLEDGRGRCSGALLRAAAARGISLHEAFGRLSHSLQGTPGRLSRQPTTSGVCCHTGIDRQGAREVVRNRPARQGVTETAHQGKR
jgi:hypothetical protein